MGFASAQPIYMPTEGGAVQTDLKLLADRALGDQGDGNWVVPTLPPLPGTAKHSLLPSAGQSKQTLPAHPDIP